MFTTRRTLFAALAALAFALLPGNVSAQAHDMASDGASTFPEEFPHGVTFWTRREPDGCWLCAPAIDINGGLFKMKASPNDISETFWRLHSQWVPPPRDERRCALDPQAHPVEPDLLHSRAV